MPATYNGIGTHYYGKKNLETRTGRCQHCGTEGLLSSYDTRLWFVVVFIPIIPLARKRIIEYCSACTRHYTMEPDKWETAKQLEISGAMEKFRSNPSPEAAMEAHQQLVNFYQTTQAAEFRKMMREKYADNAKVQVYLGLVLTHLREMDEAAACFAKALVLRPDMPEARVGVAESQIRAGRLNEARHLLDFLEKPGAEQLYSLQPLEDLARAYQNANQHTEALEVFATLQRALPNLSDITAFRRMVEKSEKALARGESMLPRQKFSWRRMLGLDRTAGQPGSLQLSWRSLAVVGVLALLGLFALMASNEYIRRHRTLSIVNETGAAATVNISGQNPIKVSRGLTRVTLPEGRHHASIAGLGQPQEVDFDIRGDYFSRWFDDPAWVLNVGGAAVLLRVQATYSKYPTPPNYTFHFGTAFEHFPAITHLFVELPRSIQVKSGQQRTLTSLALFHGEMAQVFYSLKKQERLNRCGSPSGV